jgi:hypothetical protein
MKAVDITIRINILDEAHFMQCAKDFYFKSWEHELETYELGAAALELIALSNMNPSPADLGFEYVSYNHSVIDSRCSPISVISHSRFRCLKCAALAYSENGSASSSLL